jgi:hypothetical protein
MQNWRKEFIKLFNKVVKNHQSNIRLNQISNFGTTPYLNMSYGALLTR